ncbi:MAG: TonB-dependent receptor [Acidobacteriota bacterium]|nr:TonB-dependent receptor [Acidobacteriota bacterium]
MRFAAHVTIRSILLLLSAGPTLRAQTAAGEVNGTIVDRTGGAVPAAAVTLTNRGTGIGEKTQTNANGYFVFIGVQPGSYSMSVEMSGFKTAQIPALAIAVNQKFTQNLTLDIGSVSENVTVTAEPPLLQQSSAELGTVIGETAVKELPLNGRNFTQLMILTPGANPVSTAQGSGISFQDAGVTGIPNTSFYKVSLHGQENRSVLYYLDGIINTDFRGSIYGVEPIIDAVEEFKIQSHDEKAEFGSVLGGVVNLVSKSGTNNYHGSGWEFLRNNAFDARNPFTDFCNAARCGPGASPFKPASPVSYRQNEFGAAGGGPIIKNKTFFYAAYEGWRYSKPPLSLTLVPTADEYNGDFSRSYYTQQIYNPYSTVCGASGCTRQPFVGNVIPSTLISPAMRAYEKAYLRSPNLTGIVGSNYIETRPQTDTNNGWQIRLDHSFNERNNIFARLSQMWVTDIAPVGGTTETTPSTYHAYNFGGGLTHIFRANLIMDVRGGAVLKPYVFNQASAAEGTAPATSAGFKNVEQYGGMVTNLSSPYLGSDTGQRGLSQRGNPGVNWDAGVTWIKGNHNIKAGAQFIYVNRLQNNLFQQYTFSDSQTSNVGAAKTGNSLASALLGLPATYTGQLPQYAQVYFSYQTWSGYLQDEWKVKPNLTVNFGLRYDYLTKIHPLNNRLSNALDLFHQKWLIGASSVPACGTPFVDPCIPGGISSVPFNSDIVFTGKRSVSPPAVGDNLGPRIGVAWSFANKMVLRAGYGLFYDTVSARSQYAQNTIEGSAWPWTTGIGTQSANSALNGIWPGAPGNPLTFITDLEGSFPSPVVAPNPWNSAGGFTNDPNYKNPRSQQWNVEIQRQLSASSILAVAYVGSSNTRLDYTGRANAARQPSPQGTPAATIDALKLMPFVVPTWNYSQSIGWGNYNALEVKFQKHWTNGLQTLLSYTWSKSLDTSSGYFNVENGSGGSSVVQNYFTPHLNYGQSGYNIPQLLTWSTVYELPFGRGERWLHRGPLSLVLGNWEANYVFLARSGQPYNLTVTGDVANISGNGGTLSGYARPNLIGDPRASCMARGASVPIGTTGCFYNPDAFAIPSYSFGNAGRDILRNEPFFNLDFSLIKNIPLRESVRLQLRFEAFNVLNFQILGTPGTTIGLATAGIVSNISSTPRQLQMGAKFSF